MTISDFSETLQNRLLGAVFFPYAGSSQNVDTIISILLLHSLIVSIVWKSVVITIVNFYWSQSIIILRFSECPTLFVHQTEIVLYFLLFTVHECLLYEYLFQVHRDLEQLQSGLWENSNPLSFLKSSSPVNVLFLCLVWFVFFRLFFLHSYPFRVKKSASWWV